MSRKARRTTVCDPRCAFWRVLTRLNTETGRRAPTCAAKDASFSVFWHSETIMKALKSKLAKEVLSDPLGQKQLRRFLAGARRTNDARSAENEEVIEFQDKSGKRQKLSLIVVPKAA